MNENEHPGFATNIFKEYGDVEDSEEISVEPMSPQEEIFRVRMGVIIFIAGVMILYYYVNYIS